MSDGFELLLADTPVRSQVLVDLGGIAVELSSDRPGEPVFDRFPVRLPDGHRPEVRVLCLESPRHASTLRFDDWEPTARSRSFAAGYYATDHYGLPLMLWSTRDRYVVAGRGSSAAIWPYLVKVILARRAVAQGAAFLKAGAVEIDGGAVLLLGRGRGGKTTLLDALCQAGAGFIANSHVLLSLEGVRGVVTAMRVRVPDPAPDARHVEVLVDPTATLRLVDGPVPLRAVCLVEYRARSVTGVVRVTTNEVIGAIDHFGLGIHVYGLHEDLLDDFGGSFADYSDAVERQRDLVIQSASCVPNIQVSADVQDPVNLARVLAAINQAF